MNIPDLSTLPIKASSKNVVSIDGMSFGRRAVESMKLRSGNESFFLWRLGTKLYVYTNADVVRLLKLMDEYRESRFKSGDFVEHPALANQVFKLVEYHGLSEGDGYEVWTYTDIVKSTGVESKLHPKGWFGKAYTLTQRPQPQAKLQPEPRFKSGDVVELAGSGDVAYRLVKFNGFVGLSGEYERWTNHRIVKSTGVESELQTDGGGDWFGKAYTFVVKPRPAPRWKVGTKLQYRGNAEVYNLEEFAGFLTSAGGEVDGEKWYYNTNRTDVGSRAGFSYKNYAEYVPPKTHFAVGDTVYSSHHERKFTLTAYAGSRSSDLQGDGEMWDTVDTGTGLAVTQLVFWFKKTQKVPADAPMPRYRIGDKVECALHNVGVISAVYYVVSRKVWSYLFEGDPVMLSAYGDADHGYRHTEGNLTQIAPTPAPKPLDHKAIERTLKCEGFARELLDKWKAGDVLQYDDFEQLYELVSFVAYMFKDDDAVAAPPIGERWTVKDAKDGTKLGDGYFTYADNKKVTEKVAKPKGSEWVAGQLLFEIATGKRYRLMTYKGYDHGQQLESWEYKAIDGAVPDKTLDGYFNPSEFHTVKQNEFKKAYGG